MGLYTAPDNFWELPAGASTGAVRADLRAAITESVSAPLLNGKVLAQAAVTGSDPGN